MAMSSRVSATVGQGGVRRTFSAFAAAAVLTVATGLEAQQIVRAATPPGKQPDELRLVRILSLPDSTDAGQYNMSPRVAVDQGGNYYTYAVKGATIHVFDARGQYLKSIGRRGGGPGEYQSF